MKSRQIHYVMWKVSRGGIELSVNHYINHFSKDYEIHIYSLRPKETEVYDESLIHLHEAKQTGWRRFTEYYHHCRKYKGAKFHILSAGGIILLLTLMAGVRRPLYHIRGTKYWKKNYDYLWLKPMWLINSLFRVDYVANSEYSGGIFHRKVLRVNPKVIYNGFSVDSFFSKRKQRQALKIMGYAGRLYHGKNVDLVIRLFEEIAPDHPEVELHIAGTGLLQPELEKQAAESKFADRIKFVGFVSDVAEFYASIDLLVFVSAYESFGNVLAEALLTGLPILTSNVPVFHEIHRAGDFFQLGDPANYQELSAAFKKAVDNYPALANKAYEISEEVKQRFDVRNHISRIDSVYQGTALLNK